MKQIKNLMSHLSNWLKINKKSYVTGMVIVAGLMVTVLTLGAYGYRSEAADKEIAAKAEVEAESEEETEEVANFEFDLPDLTEEIYSRYALPAIEAQLEVETESLEMVTASEHTLEEAVNLYTDQDYTALLQIVEAEATSEDIIGRILVANVVLNRVKSNRFPDTIYDVVHQEINGRYQFSPLYDGRYYTVTVSEETKEAVERAVNGEDYSEGALFFVARSMASDGAVSWFDKNLKKVKEYGVHEFFAYY